MLFRHRHIVYLLVGIDFKAIPSTYIRHTLCRIFNIIPFILKSEHDIFCRAKEVHKLKMLMDHSDLIFKCILGRTDNNLFPVYEYMSLVGIINSRYHIHESRFSTSVFAKNRKYFTVSHSKIHIFVRNYTAKTFTHASQLYRWNAVHAVFLRFLYCAIFLRKNNYNFYAIIFSKKNSSLVKDNKAERCSALLPKITY